jgi:hypothetical protein
MGCPGWRERRPRGAAGPPLPIASSRMVHLWDALAHAYAVLGFEKGTGGDEVFPVLALARIIEPTSKLDSAPCPGGGRCRGDLVSRAQSAPSGVFHGLLAAEAVGSG